MPRTLLGIFIQKLCCWQPRWLLASFHASGFLRGGDLIFSAINPDLKRAVKVIHNRCENNQNHHSNGGTYYPFQPYLTVAQHEPMIYGIQLSIIADLSPESERWSRQFITAFCIDRASVEKMEELIASYETHVDMPSAKDFV